MQFLVDCWADVISAPPIVRILPQRVGHRIVLSRRKLAANLEVVAVL